MFLAIPPIVAGIVVAVLLVAFLLAEVGGKLFVAAGRVTREALHEAEEHHRQLTAR